MNSQQFLHKLIFAKVHLVHRYKGGARLILIKLSSRTIGRILLLQLLKLLPRPSTGSLELGRNGVQITTKRRPTIRPRTLPHPVHGRTLISTLIIHTPWWIPANQSHELPHIRLEQPRRLDAIRQANLPRHIRSNVRIPIPIPSHPTCEFERTRRQWQSVLSSHGGLHFGIELAQKAGQYLPQHRFDDERPALRLVLRRGLDTGHFVRLPDGGNFATQIIVEELALVRRAIVANAIGIIQDFLDAAVFFQEGATIDLGWVGGEDQLDGLGDEGLE
mmetsp:Transcript_22955/g.49668  ORF Transcript_22955/g.49668 Transcript_22955/m.49668 type:complete len:275 (+) Transcript_22955:1768-2592(+)